MALAPAMTLKSRYHWMPDIISRIAGTSKVRVSRSSDKINTGKSAVAGTAQDVIPFRSWVRKLTGAERHDKLVQQAIMAGAVRRGYLKGLGESKGCMPPATPSHDKTPPPPPTQGFKPRYPTR
jgi:hypothetical protein